jgi:hypothetical protein
MMGILTSDFGMERLCRETQRTLRWETARVFREPETPTLPSDAPSPRQLGKNRQADQGLLWGHHFDGHAIAAIVRTQKCLNHRVLVSGENPANRCDPQVRLGEARCGPRLGFREARFCRSEQARGTTPSTILARH